MRQADLSLEALLSELGLPKLGLPRCLVINEIGMVLLNEDKEKKAEKVLGQLLISDSREDRFLALCFLSCAKDLEEETFSMLENFKKDPKNTDLIAIAQEQMKEWKKGEQD